MKRLLIFLIILLNIQVAHAESMANVRVRIAGAMNGHVYFLCLPGVGCLNIKAGKAFPLLHAIEMDNMFLVDASRRTKPSFLGLPASCQTTIKPGQTVTISGYLSGNGKVNQLRCLIS